MNTLSPTPRFATADPRLPQLAQLFNLLGDSGRLALLVALRARRELCVGDLAVTAGLSASAASHALRLLRRHGVVAVRRVGRRAYYRLHDQHVRTLLDIALEHLAHTAPAGSAPAGTAPAAAAPELSASDAPAGSAPAGSAPDAAAPAGTAPDPPAPDAHAGG